MTSIFGPLVGQPDVEAAVLATIKAWLATYLSEVERQAGLKRHSLQRPPAPESLLAAADFTDWEEDLAPVVMVTANPKEGEEPDRSMSVGYSQGYSVEVGAVSVRESEQHARREAGYYGIAIAGLIVHHGDLGGIASRTQLVMTPRVELPDPDVREVALATAGFEVYVGPFLDEMAGPLDPPRSPDDPPGEWPRVRTTSETITVEPITPDE